MEVMLDVIGEARPMITIPWGLAEIMGAFGSLPGAPITTDQVKSLTADNVVADNALTLATWASGPQMFGRYCRHTWISLFVVESWARTAASGASATCLKCKGDGQHGHPQQHTIDHIGQKTCGQ